MKNLIRKQGRNQAFIGHTKKGRAIMEKKESYPQGENPGKKQQQENEKQNPQDKKRKSGSEQDDNY
ncbi:MAG: hypothetical protein CO093_06850 [Alphaproteobacteria bacterium CG_4_9_14_3_um_filter_47_13]|nr:MAG: hypothetical protein CO093_06850 [Alphaproteobacteria bacterium CG_4_9_14_3_um_filter_47_13]